MILFRSARTFGIFGPIGYSCVIIFIKAGRIITKKAARRVLKWRMHQPTLQTGLDAVEKGVKEQLRFHHPLTDFSKHCWNENVS